MNGTGIIQQREKGMVRILLSQAASDTLTATGERAFAIVHRCMRGVEEPETAGRWCIHLAPVEWDKAQDASHVLSGEMKAVPIRKLKVPPHQAR